MKELERSKTSSLLTEYYELLQQAEEATDRDTAIDCIRRSTKLREQMMIVNSASEASLTREQMAACGM